MTITLNGTTGITTPALTNSGALTQTGAATLSSTLQAATTIGVGGATPASSGAGITFPATQSSSTDANTLDDYEEGSWTPSIAGGSTAGSYTYTERSGRYTKIGRIVIAECTMTAITTVSAGSGVLKITGLPFTTASDPTSYRSFNFTVRMRLFSTARNNIIAIVGNGDTVIYVGYDNNGSSAGVDYPVTDVSSGNSQIGCTVVYYVD